MRAGLISPPSVRPFSRPRAALEPARPAVPYINKWAIKKLIHSTALTFINSLNEMRIESRKRRDVDVDVSRVKKKEKWLPAP